MKPRVSDRTLLITCEHGGARIPAAYRAAFRGWEARLRSHRGYDRGALELARRMARECQAPLIAARVSRLLVDLNRGENHPRLFSEAVAALPPAERARLVARYHRPHRDRVADWIAARLAAGGRVLHVAVHTFTPVLRGRRRRMDLGLLYDPARADERRTAAAWAAALRQSPARAWRVRLNAPYRGVADGLPAALRRRFPAARYTGIELEVNQRHVRADRVAPALVRDILTTLNHLILPRGMKPAQHFRLKGVLIYSRPGWNPALVYEIRGFWEGRVPPRPHPVINQHALKAGL